jgi:hypothetical protein
MDRVSEQAEQFRIQDVGADPAQREIGVVHAFVRTFDNKATLFETEYPALLAILRTNPTRDPAKPCVYVGMSGLPPEHRFENHKHGYKSAWTVKKYGIRLLPELYEHLNPMPFEAAAQMEKDLTEDLRAQGYTVTGGT